VWNHGQALNGESAHTKQRGAENPHFILSSLSINATCKRIGSKRGRPKKNEPIETAYLIEAEVQQNEEIIATERSRLGRFVLASNDLSLDGELMLQYYKGQNAVEKGFRLLKDKSFRVAEVYLKKEERIEALSMIMALSLLIYSIAEWIIREQLKAANETVSNQLKKPTQKPTMRWIFQKFRNINEVIIESKGLIRRQVTNINDEQIKIIKLLGHGCEKYYI
jgi:transposase